MRTRCAILILVLLSPLSILSATELGPQTLQAWDEYIRQTNSRLQHRLASHSPFLWMDEDPDRRARIRQGEILVEPASLDIPAKVPQGLIHDWIGAAFIPNATMSTVSTVLGDYDRYAQIFNPAVLHAQLLQKAGESQDFSLLLQEKAPFVNTAIKSEYTSQTIRVNDHDWYTISYSTRIQQIEDFGGPHEQALPPDKGSGFVWRLYSIQKFEEKDGGVYTELEAIALSRNVPFALQWLVRPILQHLPRNSMTATLEKTRNAVSAGINQNPTETASGERSHDANNGGNVSPRRERGSPIHRAPAATAIVTDGYH